jgi:uncharacterized membrane protein YidH (DUF202 family)
VRSARRGRFERPENILDRKLQHERTALAWERTAFSGLAVGALAMRVGASGYIVVGLVGVAQMCGSAGLVVWAGRHYEDRHGRLRSGASSVHPTSVRILGLATTTVTGLTLLLVSLLTGGAWPSR